MKSIWKCNLRKRWLFCSGLSPNTQHTISLTFWGSLWRRSSVCCGRAAEESCPPRHPSGTLEPPPGDPGNQANHISNQWLSARLWYLQWLCTGYTTVGLHQAITAVIYRKTPNISRTLVGNKIVDNWTQMQLEHHLSALLQLHLHSQLNTWLQRIERRQLQEDARNI